MKLKTKLAILKRTYEELRGIYTNNELKEISFLYDTLMTITKTYNKLAKQQKIKYNEELYISDLICYDYLSGDNFYANYSDYDLKKWWIDYKFLDN